MNKKLDEKKLTIAGHLEELRKRIVYCVLLWVIVSLFLFKYIPYFYDYIKYGFLIRYLYLSPVDFLKVQLNTSLLGGLLFTIPFIVYNIWEFIKPAVKLEDRGICLISIAMGLLLFNMGLFFAVKIVIPNMLKFFMDFSERVFVSFEISRYLSFVTNTSILFGFIFEVPLLMFILGRFNLITENSIKKHRKYAVLIIFIFAAIVTPPDVISQLFMAGPLILLMEIGNVLVKLSTVFRRKKHV
ncbi:twin-arginine translocase subunit TatC [Lagierella sp.]|uniref:twin-arginine translocase subunit TatC n=1 Tax=Lagierella sp. TaxID=2849657 RepID=UPI0026381A72|nr:twin-arginine translocase subunit TatC [Lagierella sp.]